MEDDDDGGCAGEVGSAIMDSDSLSERGLVEVVVGSVFSRLFMERETGSTSKRLTCGRFAMVGGDSMVGAAEMG